MAPLKLVPRLRMGYLKREDTTSYSIRPGFVQGMSAWLFVAVRRSRMSTASAPTDRVLKAAGKMHVFVHKQKCPICSYIFLYCIVFGYVLMEFPSNSGAWLHSHRWGFMKCIPPKLGPLDVQVNALN